MRDRSAHAVMFGFDFQVNAAIVLMLENMSYLHTLRLEGNEEDIVITLDSEKKILAQAKAIEKSSSDFSNVKSNLKKTLVSLSDGASKCDTQQVVFITNSPNPFNDKQSKSIFWGPTRRQYSTLPPSAKKIVDDYLAHIDEPLDTSKFTVQVLPFETDDEDERYKVVLQVINDFIGSINANLSAGLGKRLFEVWHKDIFINGTKKDTGISLNKKELIWPIIVLETDVSRSDDYFIEQFDPAIYDEVVRIYGDTINSCCERMEFYTRVIFDYNMFKGSPQQNKKCQEFVNSMWEVYKGEFSINGIDDETLEALTKIILYNIVRRRITIDKIKQGANL